MSSAAEGPPHQGRGAEGVNSTSFFVRDGDVFVGQDASRGPWSVDHCHAGPVTGLAARAVEHAVGPEKTLNRLTLDLIRPLPLSGLRITADITRSGRRLSTARAEIRDLEDRLCAMATSLHLADGGIGKVPTAPAPRLVLAEAERGRFPIEEVMHDRPCFAHFVDIAYPPGESPSPGPTSLWMRTPPLLDDEVMSPFQHLCPLADCGNATSRNASIADVGFVNADITIVAHRQSSSEWLASSARSEWHDTGIGLSTAVLQDEKGPIATVLQTLVLTRL